MKVSMAAVRLAIGWALANRNDTFDEITFYVGSGYRSAGSDAVQIKC